MNNKLIGAAAGVLLLAGSGLALADDWKDRGRHYGGHERHWKERNWNHPGGHRGHSKHWRKHQHHHHYHHYPRWHRPRHQYGHPGKYRSWGPHYRHDDGVTIIFKGRID